MFNQLAPLAPFPGLHRYVLTLGCKTSPSSHRKTSLYSNSIDHQVWSIVSLDLNGALEYAFGYRLWSLILMFSLRPDRQLPSMAHSDSAPTLPTPSHPQQRSPPSSNRESAVSRKKLVLPRPDVFCRSGKRWPAHSQSSQELTIT